MDATAARLISHDGSGRLAALMNMALIVPATFHSQCWLVDKHGGEHMLWCAGPLVSDVSVEGVELHAIGPATQGLPELLDVMGGPEPFRIFCVGWPAEPVHVRREEEEFCLKAQNLQVAVPSEVARRIGGGTQEGEPRRPSAFVPDGVPNYSVNSAMWARLSVLLTAGVPLLWMAAGTDGVTTCVVYDGARDAGTPVECRVGRMLISAREWAVRCCGRPVSGERDWRPAPRDQETRPAFVVGMRGEYGYDLRGGKRDMRMHDEYKIPEGALDPLHENYVFLPGAAAGQFPEGSRGHSIRWLCEMSEARGVPVRRIIADVVEILKESG